MDTLEAIAGRHGVLRFRPDPVEPAKIEAVLRAAAAAPSPVNLQPWAFVVVTDPALTRQIAHYLVEVQEAHVVGELLSLPASYTARLMDLYEGFDRTPCFVFVCLEPKVEFARPEDEAVLRQWYLVSLGAAMQSLMVAATALGLGTRWFGGFALDKRSSPVDNGGTVLKELLGIPADVEIIAATPLGYHDEPPKPRPVQDRADVYGFRRGDSRALGRLLRGKLALGEVVHRERW
jgi:nitroreductase